MEFKGMIIAVVSLGFAVNSRVVYQGFTVYLSLFFIISV